MNNFDKKITLLHLILQIHFKWKSTFLFFDICEKVYNGIKVSKEEMNELNECWNTLDNAFYHCNTLDDFNSVADFNTNLSKPHANVTFIKLYKELKDLYDYKKCKRLLNYSQPTMKKATKQSMPKYGTHFNPYKQGQ